MRTPTKGHERSDNQRRQPGTDYFLDSLMALPLLLRLQLRMLAACPEWGWRRHMLQLARTFNLLKVPPLTLSDIRKTARSIFPFSIRVLEHEIAGSDAGDPYQLDLEIRHTITVGVTLQR
jgi:hypothetical protein